jgi:hypothetical protein
MKITNKLMRLNVSPVQIMYKKRIKIQKLEKKEIKIKRQICIK